jgi:hypothetical protein
MDELEQAQHELDRLQGIIARHEGHMFVLRGWLIAIVGGLLAVYYTDNIDMSEPMLQLSLIVIVVLFLILESRHLNLVEAVVERAEDVEKLIAKRRLGGAEMSAGWYDGPKVSAACREGADRLWPRKGMTLVQNLPFYVLVLLVIVITTMSLPPKVMPDAESGKNKVQSLQGFDAPSNMNKAVVYDGNSDD